jgi:hypothetical protein
MINKIIRQHNLTKKSSKAKIRAGVDDWSVSPVIRQGLLNWGYEVNVKDLTQALS